MNKIMNIIYPIITCLVLSCGDNLGKKTKSKGDKKTNQQRDIKDKKHNDIYEEYKEITFPKNIVNSDGKINYKTSEYKKWRDKMENFFRKNEEKIKEEINNDVVEAFKKYYCNNKGQNNLFIDYFFHDPNVEYRNKEDEKNKIKLDKKQKDDLFEYFKNNNIYCDSSTFINFWPRKSWSIGMKQADFLWDSEEEAKEFTKYKRKISKGKLKNWQKNIPNFKTTGISSICMCSFCGKYIYNYKGKYLNHAIQIENTGMDTVQKVVCKNEECINKNKEQKDVQWFPKLCLGKGKYNMSLQCNGKQIFSQQLKFEEFMEFSIERYLKINDDYRRKCKDHNKGEFIISKVS